MDVPEFTVKNLCPPAFVVKNTIVIEPEPPRRPVTFYFTPDGQVQPNCPGGVCPTPQSQPARRGLFGKR